MTGRTVEQVGAMATSGKWSPFRERRRRLPTRLSNPLAWTVAAKTIARVELAEGAEDIANRVRGKLRWFTVGQHGRITAQEARAAALEILALTKKGIEPREADAKRKAEPVMAELGRRFLEGYLPVHCKPSTQAEYRRSVTLFIDPALGEMRITGSIGEDLAPDDVRDTHGTRDRPRRPSSPSSPSASTTASGFRSMTVSRTRAARSGTRRPCSHS